LHKRVRGVVYDGTYDVYVVRRKCNWFVTLSAMVGGSGRIRETGNSVSHLSFLTGSI
jgi:hypothetical protein